MPDDISARWDELRRRILSDAHLLRRQGTLIQKRVGARRYWYLRYYGAESPGRRRQHSLYLGQDETLVECVRELLQELRAEEAELQQALGLPAIAKRLVHALQVDRPAVARLLRRHSCRSVGMSKD